MPTPPDSSLQTPPHQKAWPEQAEKKSEVENYWDFCPNCGSRLYNAGCKYRCPTCHYFMSCSDFD